MMLVISHIVFRVIVVGSAPTPFGYRLCTGKKEGEFKKGCGEKRDRGGPAVRVVRSRWGSKDRRSAFPRGTAE